MAKNVKPTATSNSFSFRVHPAGFIWALWAALTGQGLWALLALGALLLHEGFHILAILLLGAKLRRIELTPFGGVADVESFSSLPIAYQCLIALSGVIGSLLCYSILSCIPSPAPWLTAFGSMHLMLGAFNLLPMLPLDGARALIALCSPYAIGKTAQKAMLYLAFLASFVLLLAAVFGAWHGYLNIPLLFVAPYLSYAARQAYVSQRMHLVEQALDMRRKLGQGRPIGVDGIALEKQATHGARLKALLSMPPGKLHYFFFMDKETGQVERIVEESDLIHMLLDQQEEISE